MTNEKLVAVAIHGIKCDAVGCDYIDATAEYSESYLNAPCPKCGAPLLTEKDMLAIRAVLAATELINAALPAEPGSDRVRVSASMRGDGSITFSDEVSQ